MKDTLITSETAVLAKEKGFNIPVNGRYYWDCKYLKVMFSKRGAVKCNNSNDSIAVPTQSLLQKWLRKKHNIHVWLIPAETDKTYRAYVGHGIKLDLLENLFTQSFFTYEEALEKGLEEALNLIK